jgi:hypothetical protein
VAVREGGVYFCAAERFIEADQLRVALARKERPNRK